MELLGFVAPQLGFSPALRSQRLARGWVPPPGPGVFSDAVHEFLEQSSPHALQEEVRRGWSWLGLPVVRNW